MTDGPKQIKEAQPRTEDSGGVLSGATDMLQAAAYSSVQQPLNGITQLVRHLTPIHVDAPHLFSAPSHDNMWTSTGNIAGSVADFFVLSKGVGGLRSSVMGRAASVPILEAGTTGALFELAQPVNDHDFAANKLKSAALGFGTFATMDGAGLGLKRMSVVREAPGLIGAVGVNGVAGAAGGFTHSILGAELNGKTPTYNEIRNDVASYAAFGAMFGALDHGTNVGKTAITNRINERISKGEPIFSIGPVEVHPRDFYKTARESAQVDALTGLKNKAGGMDVLKTEIARSGRSDEPLSMTYMDLDGFKGVNDKFGHNQGDLVLKEVADFLKDYYKRATDVPIREGGDEFMVVMPNTARVHADSLAAGLESTMRLGVAKEAPGVELLANNYSARIEKIQNMPLATVSGEGQTLSDLAEQLLFARMPLTGEHVTPQSVASEVARLKLRTGLSESENLAGRTLQVYNESDLATFASQASYGFLPQIGQLLKVKGYATEAQIHEALQVQAEAPAGQKPLLGQILVEKGYAKPEQIEDVFRDQMIAKEALSRILESTPGIDMSKVGIKPFRVPERMYVPADMTLMRYQIPDVARPALSPNGIRRLNPYEAPVPGELVVGTSTGVVEYKRGESVTDFKQRGDELMFEKKAERKQKGLRKDRVVESMS
ncbi:MAG: GGDEF domain-containing protein [Candidatus Melainabacteria bacterium]|nr:MAG: GGDEF domain-containing protein [Candidatus Melainabacteria bacterium]